MPLVNLFTVILLIILVEIVSIHADGVCNDGFKGPQIVPDTDDCSSFFICHGGHKFRFSCASKRGPVKVFDPRSKTCVLRGSRYDHSKCNYGFGKPRCIPGVYTTFPHEESCSKYYQCIGRVDPLERECPYPRLYDIKSHKCLVYLHVKCGARREPKDPCEYKSNQCDDSGCIPCRSRYGTCIGYPDGPNPWENKHWTPYFVICRDQRVILHGDCRQGTKSENVQIFNPFTRLCTSGKDLFKLASIFRRF